MVNFKDRIQKFGKFLSGMVMPNIGAFIAWGLITALFIADGWFPNERFSSLVDPMLKYLLPLLIGYTGGKAIAGTRGGVIGAIGTFGVIVGSDIPMFIGAMIVGPISGYVIKIFDKYTKDKVPSGFEMLVNNFSIGILGIILALLSLVLVSPVIETLTGFLSTGVAFIINKGILPFVSIFIEPAKVLFLNNAINHGILGPIGIGEVREMGKSVLFLLESNPGPGLGVILAYFFFTRGAMKQSAIGSSIIHFFGGIHEIYFPYILMNPVLILSVILGGVSGTLIFSIFSVGLVATPSPGSIFSILALSAKGDALKILLGVFVSFLVSFVVSSFFMKRNKSYSNEDFENAKEKVSISKGSEKINLKGKNISEILFACDAGMGSSAMGASKFKGRLKKEGIEGIEVSYLSVDNIKKPYDIIVTHENLKGRVNEKYGEIITIKNFLNDENLDKLFDLIVSLNKNNKNASLVSGENTTYDYGVFNEDNIVLDGKALSKEEAITLAGEVLFKNGYVEKEYISGMLRREESLSTYIGMGVAIPHGGNAFKDKIIKNGISLIRVNEGVKFGENTAYLIFGIAGEGDSHIKILSDIAEVIGDESSLQRIKTTNDKKEILEIILGKK